MLNINDLESRWFKYKLKSYFPYILASIFITLIIILSQFIKISNFVPTQDKKYANEKETTIIETASIPKATPTDSKPAESPIKVASKQANISTTNDEKKTLLAPSLKFINNIQEDAIIKNKHSVVTAKEPPKVFIEPQKTVAIKAVKKEVQEPQVIVTQPIIEVESKVTSPAVKIDKKISITRETTHDDIDEVIKRFNKNNNPALSLFIAKKYYELGDYHKAYNYALITNDINNDIEASWILFAKSLMKLGEEDMAKQTLTKYIKHSNSNRARLLLDQIISRKFQ